MKLTVEFVSGFVGENVKFASRGTGGTGLEEKNSFIELEVASFAVSG